MSNSIQNGISEEALMGDCLGIQAAVAFSLPKMEQIFLTRVWWP